MDTPDLMPATVVNLTVHGIGPTVRELEPGEDRTWVTVEQFELVLDAVVGRPDVRITFDDGNSSDVEFALPRLTERGLVAEFFICAGLFGRPGRIAVDDVKALLAAGMSVGSHGWSHRDWRTVDWTDAGPGPASEEIDDAHRVIADLTGEPVATVAIPFGSYDRHVLRRLRQATLRRVYTSDGGRARPTSWLQSRNSLHSQLDEAWIQRVLSRTVPVATVARQRAAQTVKRLRGHP